MLEAYTMSQPGAIQGKLLYQQVLEGLKLTDQQIVYVMTYVSNGFDAVDAHKAAGYHCSNPKWISSQASAVRYNKQVNAAIQRVMNYIFKSKRNIFRDRILNELESNAFYDISDILHLDGTPVHKEFSDYTPEQRRLVQQIVPKRYGRDGNVEVVEYKLPDKAQALKDIMRLFELTGSNNTNIDVNVAANAHKPMINISIAPPTELQKEVGSVEGTSFLDNDDVDGDN